MAIIAAQAISVAGTTPSFAAAAGGGDSTSPASNLVLRIKNASGAPINVTMVDPGLSPLGQANPDPVVAVPATTGDVLIKLNPAVADPATGLISWTYSGVTSLTVAVLAC